MVPRVVVIYPPDKGGRMVTKNLRLLKRNFYIFRSELGYLDLVLMQFSSHILLLFIRVSSCILDAQRHFL